MNKQETLSGQRQSCRRLKERCAWCSMGWHLFGALRGLPEEMLTELRPHGERGAQDPCKEKG